MSNGVLGVINGADILVFSHTGHSASDHVPDIPGFRNVVCSARTYDATWGGVAVYARTRMHVSLVQDLPSYGMAWFKIHAACKQGADVYSCACYLPHGSSTYYKHEDGSVDADAHHDMLCQCITKYRALGEVVITGDLNARTACHDDRYDDIEMHEWQDMEGANIPVPTDLINMHACARMAAPRYSCDMTSNRNGRLLLDLCKQQGMLIINGRLPSDASGACTFYKHGNPGGACSLIDYFIATPSLIFDVGAVKHGCDLQVMDIQSIPPRPGGGSFDHVPVTLTLSGSNKRNIPGMQGQGGCSKEVPDVVYRWSKQYKDKYIECLMGDMGVHKHFDSMYIATDCDAAVGSFGKGIERAMHCLHEMVGRVVTYPHDIKIQQKKPCNTWYDDKCRAARKDYVEVEQQYGVTSIEAKLIYKEYRRITKAARRAWEKDKAQALLEDLQQQPKKFWKAYGKPNNTNISLSDVEGWTTYFKDLYKLHGHAFSDSDCDAAVHARMFPVPDKHNVESAACLNCDFTCCEIISALDSAANGKSAGVDGVPMEFLKHAVTVFCDGGREVKCHVLADHITHLFNMVLRQGYPASWSTGAVVPVPKPKGSLDNRDDYRGITVGNALSKLYSMVMLQRMDKWAENNDMRAKGQAGFRHGRGTPDNAFVLNHIIEKYHARKKPVYAVFIDFRKAYDCIDRDLLWQSLQSLGLHGHFMDSLMAMYKDVRIRVRVGGKLGDSFMSIMGVKQGDPLSPLLFGLFIDRFEKFVEDALPGMGVHVRDIMVKVLLYADDLVLLAESPSQLQCILDALQMFCKYNAMTVNIKKSEGVIFNKQFCPCARKGVPVRVRFDGRDMEIKPMFIYLGMLFEDTCGMKKAGHRCLSKGRYALYAMVRRCHELDIHNVYIKCHLFDSLVKPILCYGCEIWGPAVLARGNTLMDSKFIIDLEALHKGFLRQCMGLRKSTSDMVLLGELRRVPIAFNILQQSLRFFNAIICRRDDDVVKMAMLESLDMAKFGDKCWAGYFARRLQSYGIDLLSNPQDKVDVKNTLAVACDQWHAKISRNLPMVETNSGCSRVRSRSDQERDGFKLLTYSTWFDDQQGDVKSTFWFNLNRPEQIKTMACFRLGSHWLNVETERFGKPILPRSQRLCKCCKLGAREDELHLLYCPLYVGLRFTHGISFQSNIDEDVCMKSSMNCRGNALDFWNNLANFLIRCKSLREEHLKETFPT